MRDILSRLLRPVDPVRRFCKIKTVLNDGRYRVTDDRDRVVTVDGDAGYLPQTDVIIQGGRIVATGTRVPATKTYRV